MFEKMFVTNISATLTTFSGVVSVAQLVAMMDNAVLGVVLEIRSLNLTWGENLSNLSLHLPCKSVSVILRCSLKALLVKFL